MPRLALVVALAAALLAPAAASADVQIVRTQYGVPHITAQTERELGYGYAYALAEDTVCTVAEAYVTVNAQRSRYFGPDAGYQSRGNGSTANNLNSDFFYQAINDEQRVEKLLAVKDGPNALEREVREAVRGYVEGWNAWLRDVGGADGVDDPTCKGKPWVREITELDVYRRFYQLALLASSGVAIDGIAGSQPPTPDLGASAAGAAETRAREVIDGLAPGEVDERLGGLGSNALALGSEATAGGTGMLYGNPHFPWQGPERFYQAHARIPGKMDVAGGSLLGVPAVLIGHTKGLAWSHTVSTARRFVIYQHTLVPGSPTTYLVDGQPREMTRRKVTVKVRAGDGLEDRTRTLYATDQGPVITGILGLPIFPWTPATAFVMDDVNDDNFGRLLNHFFAVNKAQSVDELDAILRKYQGIPWVNTIAADSKGDAYYADIGSIPHFTDEQASSCMTALGTVLDQAQRVPVADGSRSACRLGSDPDAVAPGILGPKRLPALKRKDYTSNMNDSYWLTNPRQPLEGFDRIVGDERTERSLRTRVGLRIAEDRLGGRDGLPGTTFADVDQLRELAQGNRVFAAELWLKDLVAFCKSSPVVVSTAGPVDVSAACPVLEAWNGRDDLDARGALLFRRFATHLTGLLPVAPPAPLGPFATPFDPERPVDTPSGLNTASPLVGDALGRAVRDLEGAGLPLDAPLRDGQHVTRLGKRIPVQGGPHDTGVFNVISGVWDPKAGYTEVEHGSSFIQSVELRPGGPVAQSIVTYGQSTNPRSPRTADQTELFATKRFNTPPFAWRDVLRDPTGDSAFLAERAKGALRTLRLLDGRGTRRARVVLDLRRASRVVITIKRGRKTARRIVRRLPAGRRVLAPALERGSYTATVSTGRGKAARSVRGPLRMLR